MRRPFSRSKTTVTPPPERPATVERDDGSAHPFDVYFDPDAPAPAQDGVRTEVLTAEQVDRRAAHLSDASVAGFAVEAAVRQQNDFHRHAAALADEIARVRGARP